MTPPKFPWMEARLHPDGPAQGRAGEAKDPDAINAGSDSGRDKHRVEHCLFSGVDGPGIGNLFPRGAQFFSTGEKGSVHRWQPQLRWNDRKTQSGTPQSAARRQANANTRSVSGQQPKVRAWFDAVIPSGEARCQFRTEAVRPQSQLHRIYSRPSRSTSWISLPYCSLGMTLQPGQPLVSPLLKRRHVQLLTAR